MRKWDLDNHTSSRSLTRPAGNPGNNPAARNDHTTQPEKEPAPNRSALKPLALGDTWDLFFPGYYRSTRGPEFQRQAGGRPVGVNYAGDWYFNPKGFNDLRNHVEESSDHRWEYSGGTDLVLINGWLAVEGDPTIDWVSTISGQVSDSVTGTQSLTLANVIERITRDLETAAEDSSYGVGEVTDGLLRQEAHVGRDFMINVLSGIAAALGAKALGA